MDNTNVGTNERWVSSVLGGALTAFGVRRGSWLGGLIAAAGGGLIWRGVSGYCAVNNALGRNTATKSRFADAIKVEQTVTVNTDAMTLYQFWRQFQNLPQFMEHLEAVTQTSDRGSHWVAKAPAGTTVAWDAEIVEDRPGELISWHSLPGADVDNLGSVVFRPAAGGRGTEVHVTLRYTPPAGKLGMIVAKLFGEEPNQQVREDLRRFKNIIETGETPTNEGQTHGPRTIVGRILSPNS